MIVAVILAGGSGNRFGADKPKQFLEVSGKTILEHSVAAFASHPMVDEVCVVSREDWVPYVQTLLAAEPKVKRIIPGGKERYHSTLAALDCYHNDDDILLFHDAVRPLIDADTITRCITFLQSGGSACAVGVPCTDTIWQAATNDSTIQRFNDSTIQRFNDLTIQRFNDLTIQRFNDSTIQQFNDSTIQRFNDSTIQRSNDLTIQRFNDSTIQRFNDSTISSIPDRKTLFNAQTPQCFRRQLIRRAYDLALADPLFVSSDDCGVVVKYLPAEPIQIISGQPTNIKITYPSDLQLAERLLGAKA